MSAAIRKRIWTDVAGVLIDSYEANQKITARNLLHHWLAEHVPIIEQHALSAFQQYQRKAALHFPATSPPTWTGIGQRRDLKDTVRFASQVKATETNDTRRRTVHLDISRNYYRSRYSKYVMQFFMDIYEASEELLLPAPPRIPRISPTEKKLKQLLLLNEKERLPFSRRSKRLPR